MNKQHNQDLHRCTVAMDEAVAESIAQGCIHALGDRWDADLAWETVRGYDGYEDDDGDTAWGTDGGSEWRVRLPREAAQADDDADDDDYGDYGDDDRLIRADDDGDMDG